MNKILAKQLEQIRTLLSGLEGEDTDLGKLTDLSHSFELLSHQLKTSQLDVNHDDREIPDFGIHQDAAFYFNRKYKIFRITGSFDRITDISPDTELPEASSLFTSQGFLNFMEKTELLLKTGEPQSFFSEIVSKNELMLPVYFLLEKLTLGDSLEAVSAGMIFSGKSSSELENYKEVLIENIPGIDVYLFDPSFRYILTGGREKEKAGLKNSDITGKTLFEVYDEKSIKRLFPFYRNALDGIESEGEVRIKGRVYFLHSTPVFGLSRQVVGGALISQDVTLEKEIAKNILKAKREAEDSNNAKSVFMANMSHEIRTPLNSIIGFSDILNKTSLTPEQEKFCRLITQSSQHLLSVVNEILFLFKYGMGKVYIDKKPFNIHEFLENLYETLILRANEKNLMFEIITQEKIPSVLIGDPFRVKQILLNLAGNAIKFTDEGKVLIKVIREKITRKNVFLRFEVSDSGIGIPKEHFNTIFDEFSQLKQNNPKGRKGTGLGLTIVKKLVELLNGRIHVESKLGEGSTFTVVLPFPRPQSTKKDLPEKKYELKYNLLKAKKILYADDDMNNILLGEAILKKWEADFSIAHNGSEALGLLREKKYDAVMLDIRMPELMGTEVVKQVRNEPDNPNKNTIMIAITANIMESDIQNYLKSGFDGYIIKPFREEHLYNKICNLLNIIYEPLPVENNDSEGIPLSEGFVFDTSLLMKTTGGNIDFFNKMIDTFISNARETAANFRSLQENNNWTEIGEQAHKAIPSFSFFGLKHLVKNLSRIENLALREKRMAQVGELATTTSFEIENVIVNARNSKIIKK